MSNWINVEPYASKPAAGQPRIALGILKGGATVRITFNALALDEYFGGDIDGLSLSVSRKYDDGAAFLRLAPDAEGTAKVKPFGKGGAFISLNSWAACLPRDARRSEECRLVEMEEETGALVLRCPEFCDHEAG